MIRLEHVTIRSGSFSLCDLSAEIRAGTYAVLMGETGRGKTTILEAVCGLRTVVAGRVFLGDDDVTDWRPGDRGIGYVPQDLALFPTMTVREQFEFALRLRRTPRREIDRRISELAEVLGVEPLLQRRILGLSGGEAQRVALGRAISFRPRFLLLDEPLNALDESTRDRLCELLRDIQRAEGLTVLHITHNRTEAKLLADELFKLDESGLRQSDLSAAASFQ